MSRPSPYSQDDILALDKKHVWHPYSSAGSDMPLFCVTSATGATLTLHDGRTLIDGMASWWSAIHGYNHPVLNEALVIQSQQFAHVMFGGLTHEPAVRLAKTLVDITPAGLEHVFLSDSGSVSVEVAMKMALQYWNAKGETRQQFLALQRGYHGDTIGAMSVCDPVTGMHQLFSGYLRQNLFAPSPACGFDDACRDEDFAAFKALALEHRDVLAAIILEPVVQGAGGMRFYSPEFLVRVRALCDELDLLLIADEIATGFGRTGKLFACEHAGISPDILCLGKALTGGYMTLAATLCTAQVAATVCQGESGVFMHGPTFMANPLACAVANASIELLLQSPWQQTIATIAERLREGLAPCSAIANVVDVRVLGAIGVIELDQAVDMRRIQPLFVAEGIWLRPFGKQVYMMPPYVISEAELATLCEKTYRVLQQWQTLSSI